LLSEYGFGLAMFNVLERGGTVQSVELPMKGDRDVEWFLVCR
jgi:hypothetical protein